MEMRELAYAKPRKSSGKIGDEKARIAKKTEEALELAHKAFEIIRLRDGKRNGERRAELDDAIKAYSEAIGELSELRSCEAWKLEREILPDELKNIRLRLYDLPDTVIPFSLSNSLRNPNLDEKLKGVRDRCDALSLIARILDVYARVRFCPELIGDFYRSAAAELRLSGPDDEDYLESVIRHARELAERHRELTGKPHNLKMDLHKSITTQTGDRLSQPNPEKKPLIRFRHEKTPPGDSIAASLRLRWGTPVIEGIPTGRKYVPPRKAEFESQLKPVAPEGSRSEWVFAHGDLPGMLFSREQCAEALVLAANADFFTERPNSKVRMPEPHAGLIAALRDVKEFRMATAMRDRRCQLKLTLELLQMELHVANILDAGMASETPEAWGMAREHFGKAYEWMNQFEKEKDQAQTAMTAVPVRRMIQIWSANKQMAPFEIALTVALEMRADNKSLTTVRPSYPEMAPPPAVDRESIPSLRSPKPPSVIPEEWIDAELEEALALYEGGNRERVQKHARKLRYLFAMGAANEAGETYRGALERLLERYSVDEVMRLAAGLAEAELAEPETSAVEVLRVPDVEVESGEDEQTSPGMLVSTEEESAHDATTEEESPKPRAKTLLAFPPVPAVVKLSAEPVREPAETPAAEAEAPEAEAVAPEPPTPAAPKPAKTLVLEEPDELTQPAIRPIALMLGRLGKDEKEIVMAILGKQGDCAETELEEFRALHPGLRDFRFRNMLSAVWTGGDWRGEPETGKPSDSDKLRSGFGNLCSVCALSPATLREMRQAATDPANLTVSQLALVGRFLGINPGNVTPAAVEMFGVWLSGDQGRLQAYWNANYPDVMRLTVLAQKMATYNISNPARRQFTDEEYQLLSKIFSKGPDKIDINDVKNVDGVTAYANRLKQFHQRWFGPSISERQNFWRRGRLDLVSVADLAHRMHFIDNPQPANEDSAILNAVYGRPPADRDETAQGIANVSRAILYKSYEDGQVKKYLPELLAINENIFTRKNMVDGLRETARLQDEARTLGDFLGASISRPHARLLRKDAACSPKYVEELVDNPQGGDKVRVVRIGTHTTTNDDTISQAIVETPDHREIELDLVADGMGGHSTGYVASGIMRSVFEISAMAGLIQAPEDVRRVIVMADLAITMETITKKKQTPRLKGYEDQLNGKEMGTTATVSFLCGEELYLIHVGDSPAELFDQKGELAFTTVGHAYVNEFLSAQGWTMKSNQPQLVAREITKHGLSFKTADGSGRFIIQEDDFIIANNDGYRTYFRITRNGQDVCTGEARPMLMEKLAEVLEIPYGNVITGAVGNTIRKASINNQLKNYAPIKFEDGMLLSVASDGISVPLCSHEIPIMVNKAGGDLESAASEIVRTAEARTPNGTRSFKPSCQCDERGSKNDDKSVILKLLKKKS